MRLKNKIELSAVFFVALILVSTGSARPMDPITNDEMQARLGELAHQPWDGKSTNKGTTVDDGCLLASYTIQVIDPVNGAVKSYPLRVESPKASKPVPVIIIVPTIDGTRDALEPVAAHSLCQAGFASIIADVNDVSAPKVYPSWGAEDINDRQAMLALKTVVDFAQSIPRFDKDRVGAMGISLGGITTAMFAGVESRLKASVIVVGGGNMPYTLALSDEGRIDSLRRNRMKAEGFTTIQQYEDKLRETMKYDPMYFAANVKRENVMMVMAETDVKVPYVVQRELWTAYGKPTSLVFTGGHVATIIQLVYLYMDDVTSFFQKRLAPTPAMLMEPEITHKTIDLDKLGL